ncbi:vesicle-associated membrane protein 711-like protein isoform X1 [Gossypium australe]|uniref:Vesicle-associated membrane protein 711-like protein isoform X1 n=1 Tax=Gossypium australe TaxID=47621 RepID=A0A5B6W7Q3_9ROSI|nr:vesicle-associated membrane protein 711-like protein isoform X1 [Gossypium australe]
MGILYGMVARGQVVLAEFSATQTNASVVARLILDKMKEVKNNSISSFSHHPYIFHVKGTDGLTVLCMADDASGRITPFAFLEDIHKKFVKTFGRAVHSASAYAMNDEFSRVLCQQIDHFSRNPNVDRLNRLKGEMNQVLFQIYLCSFALERGDRLALLVEKAITMQQPMQGNNSTVALKRKARSYKNAMWWRDCKFTATLMLLFLLTIVYVSLAFVCNGLFLSSCFNHMTMASVVPHMF